MSLLAKRRVTYTVPPEPDILAALDEYEGMGDKPPKALDTDEAIAEWKAERARLLQVLEAVTLDEWCFSLSTVTFAGQMRYNAAMRRFGAWHVAQYGNTPLEALTEANKEPESDAAQATIALWNAATAWATIFSALSTVEMRRRPLLDVRGESAWVEVEAPDWADYATFEATVPGELATALWNAADSLNPGLWSVNGDGVDEEAKKKRGGVHGRAYVRH